MPDLPSGIDQWHVDTYDRNILFALQQKESKFEGAVSLGTMEGKKKRFEYVGPAEMEDIGSRYEDTKITQDDFYNRWISTIKAGKASMVDCSDIIKALTDPKSSLVKSHAMAANRKKDARIIKAFNAIAYIGEEAETPVEFPKSQIIPIHFGGKGQPCGFTLAKLRRALRILNHNEVDKEERFCSISSYQLEELLATTEITNQLYNDVKALVDGRVDHFLGFKFIDSEMLPWIPKDKKRSIFSWQKECMKLGTAEDVNTRISEESTKNYNYQVATYLDCGAVRLFDKGVVEIECLEDEDTLSLGELQERNEYKGKGSVTVQGIDFEALKQKAVADAVQALKAEFSKEIASLNAQIKKLKAA